MVQKERGKIKRKKKEKKQKQKKNVVQIEEESADGVLPFAWFARCLRPVNKQGVAPPPLTHHPFPPSALHFSRFPFFLFSVPHLLATLASFCISSVPSSFPSYHAPLSPLQLLVCRQFQALVKNVAAMLCRVCLGCGQQTLETLMNFLSHRSSQVRCPSHLPASPPAALARAQIYFYIYIHISAQMSLMMMLGAIVT